MLSKLIKIYLSVLMSVTARDLIVYLLNSICFFLLEER